MQKSLIAIALISKQPLWYIKFVAHLIYVVGWNKGLTMTVRIKMMRRAVCVIFLTHNDSQGKTYLN